MPAGRAEPLVHNISRRVVRPKRALPIYDFFKSRCFCGRGRAEWEFLQPMHVISNWKRKRVCADDEGSYISKKRIKLDQHVVVPQVSTELEVATSSELTYACPEG